MKKLFLFFIITSLLIAMISGCDNITSPATEGDAGQSEDEFTEAENSPGPAPNSVDSVSDGPGWEDISQE